MEQMPVSIDKLIELPVPSDPQLSPDGQWIAYTVTQPDWKQNDYISQLYLVATDGDSSSRRLTYGKVSNRAPRWSPDSQHLIFLSKRADDEQTQIYRMAIAGGEAERLTEHKTGISDLTYAPDGQSIAFVAKSPDSPAKKKRKETYGDYIEDNVDYTYNHLWSLTLDDRKITQLTSGDDFHVRGFTWHPDSQQIAISASPAPDMDVIMQSRIYLLTVATFELRPLTAYRTFSPCWSPDGSQLLYQRGEYDGVDPAFHKNTYLEVIDPVDDTITPVAMSFDEDTYPLKWTADSIYFYAFRRTSMRLMSVKPDGSGLKSVIPDDMDDFMAMQYTLPVDGSKCATVFINTDRFYEVAVIDTTTSDISILTDFDEPTRDWDLPSHELISWTSEDGTQIEGILTKPVDFDPDKKYPLFVITHGGPTWISFRSKLGGYERRLYPLYQWVHQGAIVLQPNYRGSAGYGEEFRSLNVRNLGTGDYADVISGVDALIAEGYIDQTRIAKMGWSQGGYISAFTTTYSDRFAAVSVGAGISNWMTYYVNTDIHPFTISYLKATPWDDPEIYAKTSPMTYIKQAQTPTLIQHGQNDQRVPLPNAYELHQGLLDQGVQSKLVVYPGMGHGPSKPKQVRHIMTDNYNWFNQHIFGIAPDDEQAKPVYIALKSPRDEATLVEDVYHLAQRDAAHFRVIGANGMLVESSMDAIPSPEIDGVQAIADAYQQLIANLKGKQVILFSDTVENDRCSLAILGCLQIAASYLEDVSIEHRASENIT